jgi:7-carboxy-7-deazaguanine synthase
MNRKKENTVYIDEIFTSIQGESTDSGLPCTFIRTFGCDIGCSFCDQKQIKGKPMSITNIVWEVQKLGIPLICITGGEPMMQWNSVYPLVLELVSKNYTVGIETSGCYPINDDLYNRSFKYIMDIKCPSSGVSDRNILDNLMALHPKDEVKFVISNREDYDYMKRIMRSYPTQAKILISPCFSEDFKPIIGKDLIDWILKDRLYNARVQIQVHKCLGVK